MFKTKKVLILCTDFMYYAETHKRAFEKLGWDALVLPSHLTLRKNQYIRRLLAFLKITRNRDDFLAKKEKYNNLICSTIDSFHPELLYCCFLPNQLFLKTIQYAKEKGIVLALLLPDTIDSEDGGCDNISLFDCVFSYEKTDIVKLKRFGIDVLPLLGSYDEQQYYPMNCDKTIDVSFVGKMYDNRRIILEKLVYDFPTVKFRFYGEYAPFRKIIKYLRWFASPRIKECFVNKNIPFSEVNKVYNSSKIVLDIHCERSKDGWSSRLPEISATGVFQIVDSNPSIEEELGTDFVTFKNYEELKEKIDYYLNNEAEREIMAEKEWNRIKGMTRYNDAVTVLKVLNHEE